MTNSGKRDYSGFEDEELMHFFQNGFNEAFKELVNRYQSPLFYRMNSFTRNREDSEDLVQDSFLCVARFKQYYSPNYKFSNWLFTISKNQLITRYRKNRHMIMTSHLFEPVDAEILQDSILHHKDLASSIAKAIGQLPPLFAVLVKMRVMEERSYQEIQEVTGLPLGTIKSRIKRGRARLQMLLRWHLQP